MKEGDILQIHRGLVSSVKATLKGRDMKPQQFLAAALDIAKKTCKEQRKEKYGFFIDATKIKLVRDRVTCCIGCCVRNKGAEFIVASGMEVSIVFDNEYDVTEWGWRK